MEIQPCNDKKIPPIEITSLHYYGKTVLYNVDLLREDTIFKIPQMFNVNDIFNEDDVVDKERAMANISTEPIIITKLENEYGVLDGKHRLYRAKNMGQKEIQAFFYELKELEKYILK